MEDAEVAHVLRLSSMCCPYNLLHQKGNATAEKRVGFFFTSLAHLLFSTYIYFNKTYLKHFKKYKSALIQVIMKRSFLANKVFDQRQ